MSETSANLPPSDVPGHFRTVLVDTSLLVEQQKRPKYATPVREALADFQFKGASSYSKREFKHAWLQRFAYIHTVCRLPNVQSLSDVMDHITHKLGSRSELRRQLQTCMDMMTHFLDLEASSISKRSQLARLRTHMKRCALDGTEAVSQMVTGEFKGTGCIRAEEPVTESPDGSLNATIRRCSPAKIQCQVHKLFESNQATFATLADYVDGHSTEASDELDRMRDVIRLAQKSPTCLCDDRHCVRLADALIAVDGQSMEVFAANNDSEWVPIASVMGKQLRNPVSAAKHE
jgi:hypothetical protein